MPSKIATSEVIQRALVYAAEEMGIALKNSAYSPNIKERMDHSCTIFDSNKRLTAQAEHIPVHLGSMSWAVQKSLDQFTDTLEDGDMLLLNDPYISGTHLPDLTIIAPICHKDEIYGYAANKAHHSDIGGKVPGSIATDSRDLSEEGLVIPVNKFVNKGKINKKTSQWILNSVRVPKVTIGDLRAQIASNITGVRRFIELIEKYGSDAVKTAIENALIRSERLVRAEISRMPNGSFEAEDYMESTGTKEEPVRLRVKITIKDEELKIDYSGTDEQVKGPINAVWGVTLSGVYYVIRCLTDPSIPGNEGSYKPIEIHCPEGTILNPRRPAPVAGGNVETSQRNADLLLMAFAKAIPKKVTAASQGTMNNVAMGGVNPKDNGPWSYYETVAGGMGGRMNSDGIDGIQSNMTNTLNTPIESLEKAYPLAFLEYRFRENSAGAGRWRGGSGLVRSWTATAPMTVTILSERRKIQPWGIFGGENGACGEASITRNDGTIKKLKAKQTVELESGDIFTLKTPGGGGYGKPAKRDHEQIIKDVINEIITEDKSSEAYDA